MHIYLQWVPAVTYDRYPPFSVVIRTGHGHGPDRTGQSADADKKFLMSGTLGQLYHVTLYIYKVYF
jgi:hypothetical protein